MRDGIGYIRVSRVGGRSGESFQSPEQQRERILLAAAGNDVRIVGWQEDLDESGSKWQRPGFQAALRAVEKGDATVIVVARLTRFARSVLDTHRGLARLEQAGGSLLAADLNVDVTTSTGKLIRGVLTVLAEFELEVSREQWDTAKRKAVARGVKISNRAPVGYRFTESHRLEPDPATAHLIPELFRHRVAGLSQMQIVGWWHDQTGHWLHKQTVGDIIRNRAYLGEVVYGDMVQAGAHEPLVDAELWRQAQRPPSLPPVRGEGTLLAGLVYCGSCGRRMYASTGARRADGTIRNVYKCGVQSKHGPCLLPASVIRERADEHVTAALVDWARSEAVGSPRLDRDARQAADTLAKAEAELDAYLRATLATGIGEQAFAAGARERQAAIDEARAVADRLTAATAAERARWHIRDEWETLTVEERRRLIAAAVEKVIVHRSGGRPVDIRDRSVIVWRGLNGPDVELGVPSLHDLGEHAG